jgi:hypothetical protein
MQGILWCNTIGHIGPKNGSVFWFAICFFYKYAKSIVTLNPGTHYQLLVGSKARAYAHNLVVIGVALPYLTMHLLVTSATQYCIWRLTHLCKLDT